MPCRSTATVATGGLTRRSSGSRSGLTWQSRARGTASNRSGLASSASRLGLVLQGQPSPALDSNSNSNFNAHNAVAEVPSQACRPSMASRSSHMSRHTPVISTPQASAAAEKIACGLRPTHTSRTTLTSMSLGQLRGQLSGQVAPNEPMSGAGNRTKGLSFPADRQLEPLSVGADVADLPRGHAGRQCAWLAVAVDHGAGGNECAFANRHSAIDGAVGSQGRAAARMRSAPDRGIGVKLSTLFSNCRSVCDPGGHGCPIRREFWKPAARARVRWSICRQRR